MLAAGAAIALVRRVRGTLPLAPETTLDVPGRPRVLATPGHTYGHVALHLPDRDAVITGDALVTLDPYTGRRVAVLEARTVGAVATGNTTAKLSLLRGMKPSSIRRQHSLEVADAHLEVNRAGRDWLLELCERRGVDVQRRPATTYALTALGGTLVEGVRVTGAGRRGP